MELRHLRYFVAVAEAGSVTVAAARTLHTSQPSLSRQLRALEIEVGTALLSRSARGVALTAAGQEFLGHARLALAEAEQATEAARRAAHPERGTLSLGFLSGCEPRWLPAAMHVLDGGPRIEVGITSAHSPELARDLAAGKLDAAFLRPERGYPDLAYRVLVTERLVAVLPSDHRLAAREAVEARDLVGETFIGMAEQAPVLRALIEDFFRRSGVDLRPAHRVEYLSMAISLVASTRGVALLPDFARDYLTWSVVWRPLAGEAPSIDLVLGHHKANRSAALRRLVAKAGEMVTFVGAASDNALRRMSG